MNTTLPDLLTPDEVAIILKVSYHKALDIIKQNFRYVKVGKQYRVPRSEIEKILNAKGVKYL